MQSKNTNGISLGEQMVVIAIVLVSMGLSIYGVATLAENKMQSTQSMVAYGYRAPNMPCGSVQSMPVYTPTVRHTSHSTYTGTYVSPRAYQSGHRSTSIGGGGYRVHERQFTSTGYAGGNGGGSISGGSTGGSSHTSSECLHTGSVSFAMPTIAMNSRIAQNTAMEESMAIGGPRRILQWNDDEGYYEEDGESVTSSNISGLSAGSYVGQTVVFNGTEYQWNGTEWVLTTPDVDSPIGALPFLLMLLLCAGYVWTKKRKEANLA